MFEVQKKQEEWRKSYTIDEFIDCNVPQGVYESDDDDNIYIIVDGAKEAMGYMSDVQYFYELETASSFHDRKYIKSDSVLILRNGD